MLPPMPPPGTVEIPGPVRGYSAPVCAKAGVAIAQATANAKALFPIDFARLAITLGSTDISTRSANRAASDVARLSLMFVMRLLALREQEPFVNVMIDKVPRQHFVVRVLPRHVKAGIREAGSALARFAFDRAQLVPDRARVVASALAEPFENRPDPPIPARDQGLEIRLARRLRVELDTGASEASEGGAQQRNLALDAR